MSEFDDSSNIVIDFEQIEQVSQVFFQESKAILDNLDEQIMSLEANPADQALLNNLFRQVHTLKGSVGAVPGGQLLGSLAHEFEALLSKIKKEKKQATKECVDIFLHSSRLLKLLAKSLREQTEILPEVLSEVIELITKYGMFELTGDSVESDESAPIRTGKAAVAKAPTKNLEEGIWLTQSQLNEMMRISGEILVLKNHFLMMAQTGDFKSRQLEFSQGLNKISDQLQHQLAKVLKVKAEDCFKGLNALVRQAATELNKEVVLNSTGLDLLIDKNLGRDINEALLHLVRNSIDHGVEDPFDRTTDGKPSAGQLNFNIYEKNNFVVVEFGDDGRGLDVDRIRSKAIEKKLTTAEAARELSDEQIFQFIFHPGFSTKEKITTMSGRGVGMDVVNQAVEKYHGKIKIESSLGKGSRFIMEFALPQHLMMESVILSEWNNIIISVPVDSVMQIQSLSELHLTEVDQLRFCQWSGHTVPLLTYQEVKDQKCIEKPKSEMSAMFIKHKEHYFALLVDKIIGQSDLMVKVFGNIVKQIPGFRGTSVLADDRVTYVLDPEKITQILGYNVEKSHSEAA